MSGATIALDCREDILVYSERHNGTIRDLYVRVETKGSGFRLGFIAVSWMRAAVYPKTLSDWHSPAGNEPLTEKERVRVINAIVALLMNQGFSVKLNDQVQ